MQSVFMPAFGRLPLSVALTAVALATVPATHVFAELPPGSYDACRKEAPEALVVKVSKVKSDKAAAGETNVNAVCTVLRVERSGSGLATGKEITISYTIPDTRDGFAGPRIPPMLKQGEVYPAFLQKAEEGAGYDLAAYGESFTMTPEE